MHSPSCVTYLSAGADVFTACDDETIGAAFARNGGCAPSHVTELVEVWIEDLESACYREEREEAEYILEGVTQGTRAGQHVAQNGGWRALVDMMVTYGPEAWTEELHAARCDDFDDLAEIAARISAGNLNDCLISACTRGYAELVKVLYNCGANDVENGLRRACYSGHSGVAEMMVGFGAKDFKSAALWAEFGGMPMLAELMHFYENYMD